MNIYIFKKKIITRFKLIDLTYINYLLLDTFKVIIIYFVLNTKEKYIYAILT